MGHRVQDLSRHRWQPRGCFRNDTLTALEEDLDEAKAKEISQSFDSAATCMLGASEDTLAVVKQEGTEASTDLAITDPVSPYAG